MLLNFFTWPPTFRVPLLEEKMLTEKHRGKGNIPKYHIPSSMLLLAAERATFRSLQVLSLSSQGRTGWIRNFGWRFCRLLSDQFSPVPAYMSMYLPTSHLDWKLVPLGQRKICPLTAPH